MIITKKDPYTLEEIEKKNTYIPLSSLAMDLDRVSKGVYRKSYKMVERFTQEALMRKKEIDPERVKPYVARLLDKIEKVLESDNSEQKAEDILMYSILFQNVALKLR
ncbi:hypothetical protein HY407_00725 [Candidatus Gottesmanbacteria bacterium]|nr:hypothetical protein [Candidatus Gottesmanbacteria bacterium]